MSLRAAREVESSRAAETNLQPSAVRMLLVPFEEFVRHALPIASDDGRPRSEDEVADGHVGRDGQHERIIVVGGQPDEPV